MARAPGDRVDILLQLLLKADNRSTEVGYRLYKRVALPDGHAECGRDGQGTAP